MFLTRLYFRVLRAFNVKIVSMIKVSSIPAKIFLHPCLSLLCKRYQKSMKQHCLHYVCIKDHVLFLPEMDIISERRKYQSQ